MTHLDQAPTDPGPPPLMPTAAASGSASAAPAAASDRFFAWTSGLGIVRGDGWIGGVAAGIAARLRIDPLIVRAILVVAALFGFPVLFLYALAWALLPDLNDRIPLQDALRGRFEQSQLGILVVAVLGLIPVTPALLVFAGVPSWMLQPGLGGWPFLSALAVGLGVLIVGGLVFLIVRAASQSRSIDPAATEPDQRTASAASGAPGSSAAASGSGPDGALADAAGVDAVDANAATWASAPASSDDVANAAPPVPGETDAGAPGLAPDASPDDAYAAWRAQHAAWKVQNDAWRREQQDAARAARDQARRERHAHATAFSAEAAERRRVRRLTSPRTPFAYVATVSGIAAVAGAAVAVTSAADLAGALGLFTAALVVAAGMVIAGALRRRSGFLAALAIVLLLSGALATAAPAVAALHPGDYSISNAEGAERWPADAPFVQPWGSTWVTLVDTGAPTETIYIDKRSGGTTVQLDPGVTLHLDVTAPSWSPVFTSASGSIDLRSVPDMNAVMRPDGRVRYTGTIPAVTADGDVPTTEQTLVIDQESGWIEIQQFTPAEESE